MNNADNLSTKNLFGFLNIYKPAGMSSHDVIGYLRRVTKIKQIGHTGTLDPFAEGVLPVAIGKATRLIEYLDDDKAYIARFCFGKSTDTYDVEGTITNTFDNKVKKDDIIKNLSKFNGELEQYPPKYSAKKINGKKMYELARQGIEVEIKPCKVFIYKTELLDFNEEEQWADIYVKCSKGTYIRSIANDLGKSFNNGCFLSKLKRVEAGLFKYETSVSLDDLKTAEDVEKHISNPIEYISFKEQKLNDIEYNKIIHGISIYNKTNYSQGFIKLIKNNELIAIGEICKNGIKPKKVIASTLSHEQ